jgi:hypothetical protein
MEQPADLEAVRGVDLSPRMIEHARRLHPGLRFDVASATALDVMPASLGGILAGGRCSTSPGTSCRRSWRPTPGRSSPAARR